jgi:hypothetical protein
LHGYHLQAGILDEHLLIALEPEAASLCCRHLPMKTIGAGSCNFETFAPGSKYVVFDAGGKFYEPTYI